jgi:predicted esterase
MKSILLHALAAAVVIAGFSALPGCNGARDTALHALNSSGQKGFIQRTITRGDRTRKYAMFVPTNYNANSKYPAIIFLHGVGEGGSDASKNLTVGLAPFVADQMSTFPFICIFPQSESGGWDENSQAAMDVIAALDDASKAYNIDQDRVSLTGLSTGGYGTYAIGAKYKERFAALIPMASNASAEKYAGDLVNMPIRAYCNASDMFGGFGGNDRGMVERIKSLGGKNCEFTQTGDGGHDCWDGVYGSGELFGWLLQQRRHTTASSPSASPIHSSSSLKPTGAPIAAAPTATLMPASTPVRSNTNSALVPTPY